MCRRSVPSLPSCWQSFIGVKYTTKNLTLSPIACLCGSIRAIMKYFTQIVTAISLLGGRAAAITAITDANIHAAVNTYLKSKTSATTLYGAIEEW